MTSTLLPGLAALIGTLAGVTATYVVASRKVSGRVDTSEAKVIWEASESIRHDLTAELKAVKAELAGVKIELAGVSAELAALRTHLENNR